MHGRQRRLCWGSIVVGAVMTSSFCRASEPTVKEVFSVYRDNAAKLKTLHMQVVERHEFTDAFRESHRQEAEQLEAFVKSVEADPDKAKPEGLPAGYSAEEFVEQLRQQASHSRAFTNNREFEHRYEFFIDGDDYQVRTLWTWIKEPPAGGWVFPTVRVTPESLVSDYKLCRIYSRSSRQRPAARIWSGKPRPESSSHTMISAAHVGQSQSIDFPPFTAFMYVERHGGRHPIDSFFSVGEAGLKIVRSEQVDGKKLVVVDAVVPTEGKSGVQNDDGTITYSSIHHHFRGWLDLERGALPVKLLFHFGLEGQPIIEARWKQPSQVITIKELKQLENGAYYPAVTVSENYEISAKDRNLTPEQWVEVREGKREVAMEVFDRRRWNCSIVTTEFPHDEDFFVLNVPEGDAVYDLDAGKMIGALEELPPIAVGQLAPELKLARWVDGRQRTLADFRGKVVVIDFWGLWCGACRSSIPTKKLIQDRFKDQPVVFISVHTAEKETDKLVERIATFTAEQGWKYLAAIDAGTMTENSETSHAYGVDGFPTELIIGKDGRIAFNSGIAPPGMEGIYGKSVDEITKADEAKIATWEKKYFEDAGEKYPLPETLTEAERLEIHRRVGVFHMAKEIEAALAK